MKANRRGRGELRGKGREKGKRRANPPLSPPTPLPHPFGLTMGQHGFGVKGQGLRVSP